MFQDNDDIQARFRNLGSARVVGGEAELAWRGWKERLELRINGTWEEARNLTVDGELSVFRDDRIPNRPFLYGSAQLRLAENSFFAAGDRAELYGNGRYTSEFFFSFESAGDEDLKEVVPSQLTADIGATYTFPEFNEWIFALATELRNVNDAELFDFQSVPRPGRSFFAKLSVSYR